VKGFRGWEGKRIWLDINNLLGSKVPTMKKRRTRFDVNIFLKSLRYLKLHYHQPFKKFHGRTFKTFCFSAIPHGIFFLTLAELMG
jgi:hypothetical protein